MFFEHPRNGKEIKDFNHFGSGKKEEKKMPLNLQRVRRSAAEAEIPNCTKSKF